VRRRVRRLIALALLGASPLAAVPDSKAATGPIADAMSAAIARGTRSFDHGIWNDLLANSVDDSGRVDYTYFQDHRDNLDRYLAALAAVDLSKLRAPELEALLLNAYNALTVASILDHPKVTTIRQIEGVWDETRHRVGRFEVTLDDIEHRLLRPFFRDPRIHFAVNCASASCAPLPRWAFRGADLDRQLEQRTRLFLSDARNVRIEGATLTLSRYFDWYGGDFTASGWKPRADTVALFVALYATPEVAERLRSDGELKVEYSDYDWSLNASRPPAPSATRRRLRESGRAPFPARSFPAFPQSDGPLAARRRGTRHGLRDFAGGSVLGTNARIRSSQPLTAGIQVSIMRSGSMRSSAVRRRDSISP